MLVFDSSIPDPKLSVEKSTNVHSKLNLFPKVVLIIPLQILYTMHGQGHEA